MATNFRSDSNRAIYAIGSDNKTDTTKQYETVEYPLSELGSSRYPHYVMFFINDAIKGEANNTLGRVTNQYTSGGIGANIQSIQTGALNSATTLGKMGVPGADMIATGMKDTLNVIGKFTAPRYRLKQCICLPMPEKVRANYTAEYGATDGFGAFGSTIISALAGNVSDVAFSLGRATVTTAGGLIGQIAKDVTKGVAPSISEQQIDQIISKATNSVINRRQEQLFRNMAFRQHSFDYLFVPRTQDESDKITEIIKIFKTYMHPELASGPNSANLITPAEFNFQFNSGTQENKSIPLIATSALVACDVNYTAIGEFVAFEGTSNPVAISLSLHFVEMEPLTRRLIEKGC